MIPTGRERFANGNPTREVLPEKRGNRWWIKVFRREGCVDLAGGGVGGRVQYGEGDSIPFFTSQAKYRCCGLPILRKGDAIPFSLFPMLCKGDWNPLLPISDPPQWGGNPILLIADPPQRGCNPLLHIEGAGTSPPAASPGSCVCIPSPMRSAAPPSPACPNTPSATATPGAPAPC